MTAADMGMTIEVTLNAAAIAAMNANHGLFAMGGSITTLDDVPNNEYTFGNSGAPTDIAELRLTLVPEPASAALRYCGNRARLSQDTKSDGAEQPVSIRSRRHVD